MHLNTLVFLNTGFKLTMATSRVLKIPQSDNDKEFVLLQATASGKKPLDLKLIGTEGEAPYMVKRMKSSLPAEVYRRR